MDIKREKPIGKRITKLREEMGLSPSQAAQLIGMPLQTYKRWESGLAKRGIEKLIGIAIFYSVTTDFLLGINDHRT